jgi:hypothetical protein
LGSIALKVTGARVKDGDRCGDPFFVEIMEQLNGIRSFTITRLITLRLSNGEYKFVGVKIKRSSAFAWSPFYLI